MWFASEDVWLVSNVTSVKSKAVFSSPEKGEKCTVARFGFI
jgi:hypothetical protein